MKRIAIALLATAAALAASSARADTRVSIGVNVGGPSYRPAPPTVVYAPPPAVVYSHSPSRGYWKEIQVKTWVPERWVVRHNRWGRPERYCEPGYFTYRTDRVWVDGRDRDGRYDNRRDYSYGYNNRDHRGWNR
jgi:hypothetical protein